MMERFPKPDKHIPRALKVLTQKTESEVLRKIIDIEQFFLPYSIYFYLQ